MTKKNLLILERSAGNLELNKETSGEYVLEGIFGEIDVKNKNNRIYTESEYVPQIKALQDKIKSSKLLGELDHPANFDISLKNVSHIIEELTYDEKTKQVRGRIRLLDTEAGKQAKALVDAGVPLQISSRAAGAVESNGQVKIKQLFTYDLVADPGFANAELSRVNESFGIANDSDIQIYEIEASELIKEDNIENNKTEIMLNEENSKFVSAEDFNKYSEYLSEEIKSLKATISQLNETTEKTETNEEVSKLKEYVGYIAETLDNSITYTETTAEGVNSVKEYTNYLAESFNESVDTVSGLNERMDQITSYTEYVAETVNSNLIVEDTEEVEDLLESLGIEIVTEEEMKEIESISEEVEEEISEDCGCAEGKCDCKVAEGRKFAAAAKEAKEAGKEEFEFEGKTYPVTIKEAEETEEEVEETEEEVIETESTEEVIEAEETEEETEEEVIESEESEEDEEEVIEAEESEEDEEEVIEADSTEEVIEAEQADDEEVEEDEEEEDEDEEPEVNDDEVEEVSEDLDLEIVTESQMAVLNYQDEVHAKLQTIIDASNRKPSTKPGFFNFVSESVQNDFNELNEDDKSTVLKAVEGQGFLSEGQIVSLWNTSLTQVQESDLPVIALMPVEYKETWDKLSEGKRTELLAQSKFHNTNSKYEVKSFWQTRDMRETSVNMDKVSSMNESNIHMSAKPASSLPYDLEEMKAAINKQFKK